MVKAIVLTTLRSEIACQFGSFLRTTPTAHGFRFLSSRLAASLGGLGFPRDHTQQNFDLAQDEKQFN